GYLRAASRVTALAVGDQDAAASEARYRVPKTASQLQRVDGAPLGTRGGLSVVHTFPADGDYVFRMELHGNADGFLFGGPASGEQLELSIDGERRALLGIDPRMAEVTTSLSLKTPSIHVIAGAHRVTAAFIQRFEGPVDDRELQRLMRFYADGRNERDFESGIASALEAILASPQFVFRLEPAFARAEGERTAARQAGRRPAPRPPDRLTRSVSDLELASRLSFFLWGTSPDRALLSIACQ